MNEYHQKKIRFVKAWHRTYKYLDVLNGDIVPEEGCELIPMRGYARMEDFYLCVPSNGFFTRSANIGRYGMYKLEYFVDGEFCGAGDKAKSEKAKMLYDSGYVDEVSSYIKGYTLWRETSLGGRHINKRKEAARISHILCDEGGMAGHEERQYIRKRLLSISK